MEAPVNHIEIIDENAVIKGRNLKVKMVAGMYIHAGASIEQVMTQYNLTAAEVHAALAYYYDNLEAFAQADTALEELVESARRRTQTKLAEMRSRHGDD